MTRFLHLKKVTRILLFLFFAGITGKGYADDFFAVCESGQTLHYTITNATNHKVFVSGWGGTDQLSGDLIINEKVVYEGVTYTVDSIETSAFSYCTQITSLVVGYNIQRIGVGAFRNCSGLRSVVLYNVSDIDRNAFINCSKIEYLDLGETRRIGPSAFMNCFKLAYVVFPETVNTIENAAFANCSNLSLIDILFKYNYDDMDAPFVLGENAFYNCTGLTSVILPHNLSLIQSKAFKNCSSLTSIRIPSQVALIESEAFYGCSSLTSVYFCGVSEIGAYAFANTNIQSMVMLSMIPNSFNEGSFEGVYNVTVQVPPNCVDQYEYDWASLYWDNMFYFEPIDDSPILFEDDYLELVFLESWDINDDGIFDRFEAMLVDELPPLDVSLITSFDEFQYFLSIDRVPVSAFEECSTMTSITLPSSIASIDKWAFAYCTGLTSLVLPEKVAVIGANAFYNSGIESISIPDGVQVIDDGAFLDYNGFTSSITLPSSLRHIGYASFSSNGFTSVEIPNSVVYIGDYAFEGCCIQNLYLPESVILMGESPFSRYYLRTINVATDNPVFDSRNNCNAIIKTQANELIIGCQYTVIPNTVTKLGTEAFYSCSNPTFTSIVIPNSVHTIGKKAFYFCNYLTSVSLDESLEVIGEEAFNSCHHLSSITISASVNSIDESAFVFCEDLLHIEVDANNMTYDSRNNCNAIIETNTNRLIAGCQNTVIPRTVTALGHHAFEGCKELTSIIIPPSVTSIGGLTFYNCSALTNVYVLNSNTSLVPYQYIALYTFIGCDAAFGIYVPYGSMSAYQTDNQWKKWSSKIHPMVFKDIPGYQISHGAWSFVSSSLSDDLSANDVEEMIAEIASEYDLYRFDQSAEDQEWQNHKANPFELANGQGYLYANKADTYLIFKGTFNEASSKQVDLTYDAGKPFAGWNLVGNPFPVDAYANRSYYVMNAAGTALNPVPVSTATAIPTCTGLMVKANATGEKITFTRSTSKGQDDEHGMLTLTVTADNSDTALDKAILSFNEGDELEKVSLRSGQTSLAIVQGSEEYAIYVMRQIGETTLHFTPETDADYVIQIDATGAELNYLHLIDTMTGADIDLLQQPSYRFFAKTTDNKARFRIAIK